MKTSKVLFISFLSLLLVSSIGIVSLAEKTQTSFTHEAPDEAFGYADIDQMGGLNSSLSASVTMGSGTVDLDQTIDTSWAHFENDVHLFGTNVKLENFAIEQLINEGPQLYEGVETAYTSDDKSKTQPKHREIIFQNRMFVDPPSEGMATQTRLSEIKSFLEGLREDLGDDFDAQNTVLGAFINEWTYNYDYSGGLLDLLDTVVLDVLELDDDYSQLEGILDAMDQGQDGPIVAKTYQILKHKGEHGAWQKMRVDDQAMVSDREASPDALHMWYNNRSQYGFLSSTDLPDVFSKVSEGKLVLSQSARAAGDHVFHQQETFGIAGQAGDGIAETWNNETLFNVGNGFFYSE